MTNCTVKIDDSVKTEPRKKYLILADKNKNGREQYVVSYVEDNKWEISCVPIPMSKTKTDEIIAKVKREYPKLCEQKPFKYKKDITFKIVEYNKQCEQT